MFLLTAITTIKKAIVEYLNQVLLTEVYGYTNVKVNLVCNKLIARARLFVAGKEGNIVKVF